MVLRAVFLVLILVLIAVAVLARALRPAFRKCTQYIVAMDERDEAQERERLEDEKMRAQALEELSNASVTSMDAEDRVQDNKH